MIMSIFNLQNEYDIPKFKEYVNKLFKERAVVEVKKKLPNRTLAQNRYFYLLLSWFASETGYSVEEVKIDIFKRLCNRDIFEREKTNKKGKIIKTGTPEEIKKDTNTTNLRDAFFTLIGGGEF